MKIEEDYLVCDHKEAALLNPSRIGDQYSTNSGRWINVGLSGHPYSPEPNQLVRRPISHCSAEMLRTVRAAELPEFSPF